MSRNSINFNDKKIKKSDFYKNKKMFQKKKNTINIIHFNTLLGIMIILLLNHYI